MEAVPRMPMLSFELKNCSEPVEFTPSLKSYIAQFYNEDPGSYAKECAELDQLRQTASRVSRDFMGCSTLKRYYSQLQFLSTRFPMGEGEEIAISFTWDDVYTGIPVTHTDIKFEQACILYNIGALHSLLGAMDNRQSAEGMKVSCTHFQCASWAFQQIQDNFSSSLSPDMAPELLIFKINLMLAQGQECILEKSMTDNRKSTITAKVAAQIVEYYKQASRNLDSENAKTVVGNRRIKEWKKRLDLKQQYHQCIMYLYLGNQADEQQKSGERLAYYQGSLDKLNECIKLSKKEDEDIEEALRFTMDVVGGKYNSAKKDNDFVFHDKVPELSSLPEIKGASLVKGIPFDTNDPEVSGPDIFKRLVPMEAHETSSLYSEEKAKLLRRVGAKVDEKNQELEQYLASLKLDPNKLQPEPERLPQAVLEKCAAISVKPNAIKDLVSAMQELSGVATEVEGNIREILSILDDEERKEKEFSAMFGQRAPNIVISEITKERTKYQEGLNKASQSNTELHKAMNTHISNLKLLSGPLDELQAALPAVEQTKSPEDEALVQEIQKLMSKVEEMRTQRQQLEEQFRKQVHQDDITTAIVTRNIDNTQDFFDMQLKKHEKLESLIDQNITAQKNILRALTEANAKYATVRKSTSETSYKRDAMIQSLIQSYDVYEDLLAKSRKGIEFYKKLETNVSRLLDRTKGVCHVQEEERQQILARSQPKGPPPARPTAPKPRSQPDVASTMPHAASVAEAAVSDIPPAEPAIQGPTLKDYLPFMKPKTFGPKSKRGGSNKTDQSAVASYPSMDGYGYRPAGRQSDSPVHVPHGDVHPSQLSSALASRFGHYPSAAATAGGHYPSAAATGGGHYPTGISAAGVSDVNGAPGMPGSGYGMPQATASYPSTAASSTAAAAVSTPAAAGNTGKQAPLQPQPASQTPQNYGRQETSHTVDTVHTPIASPEEVPTNIGNPQQAVGGPPTSVQSHPQQPAVPPAGQYVNQTGMPPGGQNIHQPGVQPGHINPQPMAPTGGQAAYQTVTPPSSQYTPQGGAAGAQEQYMYQHPHGLPQQNTPATPQVPLPDRSSKPQGSTHYPNMGVSGGYGQYGQQMSGAANVASQGMNYGTPPSGYPTQTQLPTSKAPASAAYPTGYTPGAAGQHYTQQYPPTGQQGYTGQFQSPQAQTHGAPQGPQNVSHGVPQGSQSAIQGIPQGSQSLAQGAQQTAQQSGVQYGGLGSQSGMAAAAYYGQTSQHQYTQPQQAYPSQAHNTQPSLQSQMPQQKPQPEIPQSQALSYQAPPGGPHQTYQQGYQVPNQVAASYGQYSQSYGQTSTPQVFYSQAAQYATPSPAVPAQTTQPTANYSQFYPQQGQQTSAAQVPQTGTKTGYPQTGGQQPTFQQPGHPPSSQYGQYQQQAQYNVAMSQYGGQAYGQAYQASGTPIAGQYQQPHGYVQQTQQQDKPGQQYPIQNTQTGTYATPQPAAYSQTNQNYNQQVAGYQQVAQQNYQHPTQQYPVTNQQQQPFQQMNSPPVQRHQYSQQTGGQPVFPQQPAGVQSYSQGVLPSQGQGQGQPMHQTPQGAAYPSAGPATTQANQPTAATQQPRPVPSSFQQPLAPHTGHPQTPPQQAQVQPSTRPAEKFERQSSQTSTTSSLDDLLSTSPENLRESISKEVLTPKVITAEDIKRQKEEELKNSMKQSKQDPYTDEATLTKFVGEVERFQKLVDSLGKHTLNGPSHLDIEWKELVEEQEKTSRQHGMAIARCYPLKNRDPDIMPYDHSRVLLTSGKDDYINANHIDTLAASCPKFIATQAPLQGTISDFWLMAYEQGSEVMVMLNQENEPSKQKSATYWPTDRNHPMACGPLVIQLQSVRQKQCWTERIFSLNNKETHQSRSIAHLHFPHWPPGGSPERPSQLLQFISEVQYFYIQQRSLMKPVIVHCSNGVGRTGAFIVVYTGVQEINQGHGILEIKELVKQIRQKRKYLVQDTQQYMFCYHAVLYYAQDLLMKRGILTNKASFGDRLPSPGEWGHQRKPSEDFVLGTGTNANQIQNNISKGVQKDSVSAEETTENNSTTAVSDGVKTTTNETHNFVTPAQNSGTPPTQIPQAIVTPNVSELTRPDRSRSPSVGRSRSDSNSSARSAGSLPGQNSLSGSPQHKPGLSSTTNLPLSLADLQNPDTFNLDTSNTGAKKRITKASFQHKTGSLQEKSVDPNDPLSMLDPMWTMKGKEDKNGGKK